MKEFMVPGRCEQSYKIDPRQRQLTWQTLESSASQRNFEHLREELWGTNSREQKQIKKQI